MIVLLIWLSLTAIALILAIWLLKDVYKDLRILDENHISNGRRFLVKSDVRSAWVKVGAFGFFVAIGVISLLRELEIVDADPDISRIGLLLGIGLLVYDAIEQRRVRHVLLSDNKKEHRKEIT